MLRRCFLYCVIANGNSEIFKVGNYFARQLLCKMTPVTTCISTHLEAQLGNTPTCVYTQMAELYSVAPWCLGHGHSLTHGLSALSCFDSTSFDCVVLVYSSKSIEKASKVAASQKESVTLHKYYNYHHHHYLWGAQDYHVPPLAAHRRACHQTDTNYTSDHRTTPQYFFFFICSCFIMFTESNPSLSLFWIILKVVE